MINSLLSRPILNGVELVIYNKLDAKLIVDMNMPLANAIAIDPDPIATLTYSITSVRILNRTTKSSTHQQMMRRRHKHAVSENDSSSSDLLFRMDPINGNLHALRTEMPCADDCQIHIQYRADDLGRYNKSRVSRKRTIKLSVKRLPLSLFNINDQADGEEVDEDRRDEVYKKTFELSEHEASVDVSETTKIGDKIYKVSAKTRGNSLVFFSLRTDQDQETSRTFYLSNQDGSLYLVRPLDFETCRVFNLTVLVTNWVGQVEYVRVHVNVRDVNDVMPSFQDNSTNFNLSETLSFDVEENEDEETEEYFRVVYLMQVSDADDPPANLTFKIEDCFHLSRGLLLKKPFVASIGVNPSTNHLNYPLCSRQFIELVVADRGDSFAALQLRVNLRELKSYLFNLTDFYLRVNCLKI